MDSGRALQAEKAEAERLRAQLARLKEQLIRGQDDEEEAMSWRIEAEVRAAQEAAARREAELVRQLEEARATARAAAAADGGAALQEALQARETELANLQAALGEMSYEVEAAEKLRSELREAREGAAAAAADRDAARAALDGELAVSWVGRCLILHGVHRLQCLTPVPSPNQLNQQPTTLCSTPTQPLHASVRSCQAHSPSKWLSLRVRGRLRRAVQRRQPC